MSSTTLDAVIKDECKTEKGVRDETKFKGMKLETLKKLIDLELVAQDQTRNMEPEAETFLEFLERHPKCSLEGDLENEGTEDAYMTITAILFNGKATRKLIMDFAETFHGADSFQASDECLCAEWHS